jgi:CRISPR-associated endonuclease Csn1
LQRLLEDEGLAWPSPQKRSQQHLSAYNPYALHARGVEQPLAASYQVALVLYHLAQRRGFRSNRKGGGEAEQATMSVIAEGSTKTGMRGVKQLRIAMRKHGLKTYGQYFYQELQQGRPVRGTTYT